MLLGAVSELLGRARMLALVATSVLMIPAVLLVTPGEMSVYGGLSGIDSALFGYLVTRKYRDLMEDGHSRLSAVPLLCGIGFLAKMVYEYFTACTLFVQHADSMVVVPLAHMTGFLIGIAFGMRKFFA